VVRSEHTQVTKIELGSIGAVINPGPGDGFVELAVELEGMGYSTIWLTGGPLEGLDQIAEVVRATKRARVASGIISVDRFPADDVAALYAELEGAHPGRFVVGLGGAHGTKPMATLTSYLYRLDAQTPAVPPARRLMAALGPRMVDLARERAAGAFPVLITPEYTAQIRSRLGDDATLAVEQLVVVEPDPGRARSIARGPLGFLGRVPAYQASFRRQGFAEDEIAQLGDGLLDALVARGDADAVAAHVSHQLDAGADHVAVSLTTAPDQPAAAALDQWRQLARQLSLT
jgi:probable F420-dependent oxidoreductase